MSEPAPNPYQAPVVAEVDERQVALPHEQSKLVLILSGLLATQAAMSGGTSVGCVVLNVVPQTVESEASLVAWTNYLATATTWLYFGTFIPFGMFLVRANKNARELSDFPLHFTPASMVWWFAVPFLSLVRPYQAVKEVWRRSAPPHTGGRTDAGLIEFWWVAWLASTAGSNIIELLMRGAEVKVHNFLAAFDNAVSFAVCVLAMLMVRQLHQRQITSA